ncbi:GTPase ObgE [Candidatus Magnetominusculus xianensis]|uniref:GTPase Obg n=1 Tax=Candidatus Magnetominusculus xianensis TaxID=1748249 RepID=A0ABR5SGC6_9BACT|nr:GTPase ObgE [Candidatus Magnetominusculus xianensis]KWT81156.1 GTP-binding protein obg [Candidatus Magnetominusculus xianensis]MBF0404329.1 GTPase ObgE [Nitrospirota bacterium]
MKFVDYVTIYAKAGHGGRGCISFLREKYKPKGGPDGGDGGKGADIVFKADIQLNTLLDHRYKRHYKGRNGGHGKGSNMHGADGEDLIIKVPTGTVIKNADTGEVIADLTTDSAEAVVLKGGRGGKGNAHFKSSTYQAPKFAQPGEDGEESRLVLELKLIADAGLIGMPNAGKSTLIAAISAARPKIGPYPFTTLVPNLGVVKLRDYMSFTVADIPGIIEGAHDGAGLGLQFLRHAERTSLLLHLVDISEHIEDCPVDILELINRELGFYDEALVSKEQVVVGTKLDIAGDGQRLDTLRQYCAERGMPFFAVSAAAHQGLEELVSYVSDRLIHLKKREL